MSDATTSPGQIAAGVPTWPLPDQQTPFDPSSVNLTAVVEQDLIRDVICYINAGENEYDGRNFGARISSLFVVLVVSSAVTFFPVIATRSKKIRIPLYVYLFARYFGAGVIVATAFIHLLDPAYEEIGPATCVGMTGGWAEFSWVPALALASGMFVFLMDFGAEIYVEQKYGLKHSSHDDSAIVNRGSVDAAALQYELGRRRSSHAGHQHLHSGDQDEEQVGERNLSAVGDPDKTLEEGSTKNGTSKHIDSVSLNDKKLDDIADRGFKQQIAAFLILEFGVIFHSVIIGLTLGSAGEEFAVLYPVIVFHQSFEGLGIGARLSAIPFPKRLSWMPYWLCAGYGLCTPIAIAIGIGIRTVYNPASPTASIVSGVLDSISAGILLYTGFVELLARDFLFNPDRTQDKKQLVFMVVCVFLGAGVMSLLGKWA